MLKNKFQYFITLIVTLPAIIIGAIAMSAHTIPGIYYKLNIIYLLIGWLISCFVIAKKTIIRKNTRYSMLVMILIIAFYALTFVDSGVEGIHRWLSLGPINLYISSIVAPVLLIVLWNLLDSEKELLIVVIIITIAILLTLQPDASQLTAFSIPVMMILFRKMKSKIMLYITNAILLILVITSWIFLDSLPAVIYVEEIVGLVMDMGLIWSILGFLSLILLPMPFFLLPTEKEKIVTPPNKKVIPIVREKFLPGCLGLYFTIFIITTFFGNFPVPIMGYGISPIIGYIIAITWMIKTNEGQESV